VLCIRSLAAVQQHCKERGHAEEHRRVVAIDQRLDEVGRGRPVVQHDRCADGEGKRQAWPLAQLLAELVGADAVLLAVVGKRGRSVKIDAAAWADAGRIPLLRLNRDGELKLLWADADMKQISGQQVRRVTALVVRAGGGG